MLLALTSVRIPLHKTHRSIIAVNDQFTNALFSHPVPYGNYGCRGGNMYNAFQYIVANAGVDCADAYPYMEYVRIIIHYLRELKLLENVLDCSNRLADTLVMEREQRCLVLCLSLVAVRMSCSRLWPT